MDQYTPFCGTPPLPTELLTRWTFDPVLFLGLGVVLCAGLWLADNRKRFLLTWGVVAFLFVSPLCAASMALFSARVAQHILLTLLAAPLLASALPVMRFPAMPLALVFGILFWVWHAPQPYQMTLESDWAYWAMHLSLFVSATALFSSLRAAPERGIFATIFTALQLTIYAQLITLSPALWHDWHMLTTLPYGISALDDQQLAGAVMWVAGGGLMLATIGTLALHFLHKTQAKGAKLVQDSA